MTSFFDPQAYAGLQRRIQQLSRGARQQWGVMTLNQVVCHISDPLRDFLGMRGVEPFTPEEIRPQLIAMVISENDWPHDQPTAPAYKQGGDGGGTPPTDFESDKLALLSLLDELFATPEDYHYQAHAALGYLTREQVGHLAWKHTDYHLRQFNS